MSVLVLALGPVSIAALIGLLIWWGTHRSSGNGGPGPQKPA